MISHYHFELQCNPEARHKSRCSVINLKRISIKEEDAKHIHTFLSKRPDTERNKGNMQISLNTIPDLICLMCAVGFVGSCDRYALPSALKHILRDHSLAIRCHDPN